MRDKKCVCVGGGGGVRGRERDSGKEEVGKEEMKKKTAACDSLCGRARVDVQIGDVFVRISITKRN